MYKVYGVLPSLSADTGKELQASQVTSPCHTLCVEAHSTLVKELASMNHLFLTFVLIATISFVYARKRPRSHLPPGPPGQFLIGNVLQLPVEYQWKKFAEWGRKYGTVPNYTVQYASSTDGFERKPLLHALFRPAGHCLQ